MNSRWLSVCLWFYDEKNPVQSSDHRWCFWFSRVTLPRQQHPRHRVRFVLPTDLRQTRASLCALTAYLMSSALEMTKTMSFPSRVFDLGLTSPLSQGLSGEPGGPLAPAGLSPDWPRAPSRHFSHRRPHLSSSKAFMFRFMSRPQNYTQRFCGDLCLIRNSIIRCLGKDIETSAGVL